MWPALIAALLRRAVMIALAMLLGLLIAAFLIGHAIEHALAHGPADWIERGRYTNAVGQLCCGERDCSELADGDVAITAAGYFVRSLEEIVPYHEAQPSPDGKFWRCQWGGQRKCFFAPPPAM